jgi:hypothetical protein
MTSQRAPPHRARQRQRLPAAAWRAPSASTATSDRVAAAAAAGSDPDGDDCHLVGKCCRAPVAGRLGSCEDEVVGAMTVGLFNQFCGEGRSRQASGTHRRSPSSPRCTGLSLGGVGSRRWHPCGTRPRSGPLAIHLHSVIERRDPVGSSLKVPTVVEAVPRQSRWIIMVTTSRTTRMWKANQLGLSTNRYNPA